MLRRAKFERDIWVPTMEQVSRLPVRSLPQESGSNGQYWWHLSDDVLPEIAFSLPLDILHHVAQ
jgi:hypothetical protein